MFEMAPIEGRRSEIRDLGDFCTEWESLRETVSEERLRAADLPEETRETIRWLRLLADKVSRMPPFDG